MRNARRTENRHSAIAGPVSDKPLKKWIPAVAGMTVEGERALPFGFGPVEVHGGANQRLQRLLVYLLALAEVDGTPCVPLKAGVEETRRILESRPFGEGHLHDVFVSLACADNS